MTRRTLAILWLMDSKGSEVKIGSMKKACAKDMDALKVHLAAPPN